MVDPEKSIFANSDSPSIRTSNDISQLIGNYLKAADNESIDNQNESIQEISTREAIKPSVIFNQNILKVLIIII